MNKKSSPQFSLRTGQLFLILAGFFYAFGWGGVFCAPVAAQTRADSTDQYVPRMYQLIVKFRSDLSKPPMLMTSTQSAGQITFRPVIQDDRASLYQSPPRLSAVRQVILSASRQYAIVDAGTTDRTALQQVADELNSLPDIELVYLEALDNPPPGDIPPVTPDLVALQFWHRAIDGIDAVFARTVGADGTGVRLSDVEYGWNLAHEDLVDRTIYTEPGQTINPEVFTRGWDSHGTAVAGMSSALANAYGITGVADQAELHVYSEWTVEEGLRRLNAVAHSLMDSQPGDIVLFELQAAPLGDGRYVPAESNPYIWDLVKAATDAGVIVVAAAGNGNEDLDSTDYAEYRSRGDSGAIIVGAGSPDTGHNKLYFSTYGSRVDVQGWGLNVFTLGYGDFESFGGDKNQNYTNRFSGTSSASAMVAAAVTAIQSYARQTKPRKLTPAEMRDLLVESGTPQGSGEHIGPLVNMRAAIEQLDTIDIPPPLFTGVTPDEVTQNRYDTVFSHILTPPPVVVAAMQTTDGGDTAAVRITSLATGGMSFFVEEEESKDQEINHTTEVVGYLAVAPGMIREATGGSVVGEAQTLSEDQPNGNTWYTVSFENTYVTPPVVLMNMVTINGAQPAHVRVRNVTPLSFEYQIEEWEYLDQGHVLETMQYIALEPGVHTIAGLRVVAGTTMVDHQWRTTDYTTAFADVPVVLSQTQTYNEGEAVVTRQQSVGSSSFQVRLQEEEGRDGAHVAESVGFLAVADSDDDGGTGQQPWGGTPHAVPGQIEAEDFDTGGEGVAYHDSDSGNKGGVYRADEDVDIQATGDNGGGYNVGWTRNGEWLEYTVNVAKSGMYALEARVATPNTGKSFRIEMDGVDVTGSLIIPNTGGWQTYQDVTSGGIDLSAGTHVMRVVMEQSSVNYNYFRFVDDSGGGSGQQPWGGTPHAIPGRIQAEDFDLGGEDVAYHDSDTGNTGGLYRPNEDVDIQATGDSSGGYNVGWTRNGEWLEYTVEATQAGTFRFEARIATPKTGRSFHVEIDGVDVSGSLTVPSTGGWQKYITVGKSGILLTAGTHILRVVMETGSVNLNYIELTL